MAMALVDRALRAKEMGEETARARPGSGVRALSLGQRPGDRLRRASEAAALRRFPGRAGGHPPDARRRGRASRRTKRRPNEPRGLQLRLSGRADQAHDPARDPEGGRGAGLPGAVRLARHAAALWLGHRRHPGHRRLHRPGRRAEGDRPGRGRHHQRDLDPAFLPEDHARRGDRGDRQRRPSSRPGTARPRRRCTRARSWSTRCRSRSRCAGSSRARPRPARCMRWPTTA